MSDAPCPLYSMYCWAGGPRQWQKGNSIRTHNACLSDEFKSLSDPGNNSNACVTWKFSISVSLLIIFFPRFFFSLLFRRMIQKLLLSDSYVHSVYIVLYLEWRAVERGVPSFFFFVCAVRCRVWGWTRPDSCENELFIVCRVTLQYTSRQWIWYAVPHDKADGLIFTSSYEYYCFVGGHINKQVLLFVSFVELVVILPSARIYCWCFLKWV